MPNSRWKSKGFKVRPKRRTRFRPTELSNKNPIRGSRPLSDLPGYNPKLPSRTLRVLLDEDARVLEDLLDINLNISSVVSSELAGKSDEAIIDSARKSKRILITFNHKDFFPDNRAISTTHAKCPGIIAIKAGNNVSKRISVTALIIEQILIQIGHKVPVNWWFQTKLSVSGETISLKKWLDGELLRYRISINSRGIFLIKKL